MKFKNNLFGIAAMALCLGLASCSDDDELQFSQAQVTNSELKTILEQNGLHFDEQGHLLLDEAANNLKALDLSGKKISDYKELSVLPNLVELNLSNNEFGPTFDFGILPSRINAVDLTGNSIYYFENLVKTDESGDNAEMVRDFTKLYLPISAKYNCSEVPAYFKIDKDVDMKLGSETYTTLREIPDAKWRGMLKKTFGSIFEGDKIDVSKRLYKTDEVGQSITTINMDERTMTVDNVEGFQYIVNNPGYIGTYVYMEATEFSEIDYFPAGKTVTDINIVRISTPNGFDLSKCPEFKLLMSNYNKGLKSVDLSVSTAWGQRGDAEEDGSFPSMLQLCSCENLESLILPEKAKAFSTVDLINCPKLKEVDLGMIETFSQLTLGGFAKDCKIIYPKFSRFIDTTWEYWALSIDKAVNDKPETKAVLDKHIKNLIPAPFPSEHGIENYNYFQDYQ